MSKLMLIILVQLIYVPLLTLRTICMVKKLKTMTAFFGVLEALVYIFGLSIVLSGEQNIWEMIVYALGFAIGLVVGILVEHRMAIGYTTLNVNINHKNDEMIDSLREKGFGVTICYCEGKLGERIKLDVLTKRKREKELVELINYHEPRAFVTYYEPKMFRGGYHTELIK